MTAVGARTHPNQPPNPNPTNSTPTSSGFPTRNEWAGAAPHGRLSRPHRGGEPSLRSPPPTWSRTCLGSSRRCGWALTPRRQRNRPRRESEALRREGGRRGRAFEAFVSVGRWGVFVVCTYVLQGQKSSSEKSCQGMDRHSRVLVWSRRSGRRNL